MKVKQCQQCKKEFETYKEKQKYCSHDCRDKSRTGKTWEEIFGIETSKKMKKFSDEHKQNISKSLYGKFRGIQRNPQSQFKKGDTWEERFDEQTINKMNEYYASLKGKKRPKEIGEKISQSKIGHLVSQETRDKIGSVFRGKTYEEIMGEEKAKRRKEEMSIRVLGSKNPFYNKRHSKEMKQKLSSLKLDKTHEEIMGEENAKKWKEKMSGENSPSWKGGYSIKDYEKFTKKLKNLVRKRDNQICMLCGKHREKMDTALSVHHIDYNKYNSTPENCVSLCFECHAKTNYNRQSWITFFQSLLHNKYSYNYDEIIFEIKEDKYV